MKIAFCLQHFLPEFVAGTEIYTYNLAKGLKQQSIEVIIIVPNFGVDHTEEYFYKDIRVIKYAENSTEDRLMIKGFTKPAGLKVFGEILTYENPEIVHFQELAPGRGISKFHVELAYSLKLRIFLTFHLSQYSCMNGSLIYKGTEKCDGKIRIDRCTECLYYTRHIIGVKSSVLKWTALKLYQANLDTGKINHSVGTALGFPFIIKKLEANLHNLADFAECVVVLTKWYQEVLAINGIPREKLRYISQGLPDNGQALPDKRRRVSAPLRLVFVGRITKLKGVHLLISAIQQLPENKIQLSIYGPDADEDFANFCRNKTMQSKNIVWCGPILPTAVVNTIAGYDLLCLPSTFSEMSPLVIQEAFAAGIPVLASDVYGNSEQIKDGENGWLFRYNDVASLTRVLFELANNPQLIERAKGFHMLTRSFEEVTEDHLALYIKEQP